MKRFLKPAALLLALTLLLALAACGGGTAQPTPTPVPTAEPPSEPTPEDTAVKAGAYTFEMLSIYGETVKLTLMLKESGTLSILALYPDGSNESFTAEWADNGDGSFTTAATDPALPGANFLADDGSVRWLVDGSDVTPDGYAAPTEFVEKPGTVKDPETDLEAAGSYICCRTNKFGSQQLYVLHLYDDVKIQLWSEKTGLRTFVGNYWGMTDEGLLHIGRLKDADNPDTATPYGDWFIESEGYSSDWVIYGNHTAQPAGEEYAELAASFDPASLVPADVLGEMLPESYERSGVYTCTRLNKFGSEQLYVLNLTNDGVKIRLWSEKTGLRTFEGRYWGMTDEGLLHIGRLKDADNPDTATPYGDWFIESEGYSSDWVIYDNHTAQPAGEEYAELIGNFDYTNVVPADILEQMLP